MTEKDFKTLLDKYLNGECAADETAFIEGWYNRYAQKQPVKISHLELEEKRLQIKDDLPLPVPKRIFPIYVKYAAAAVVAIATVTCIFYFSSINNNTLTQNNTIAMIQPGGNNAVLTLADGTKINLKDTYSGEVTTTTGAVITNDTSNGVVIYQSSSTKTEQENNHTAQTGQRDLNTITTPRGGQYKLILPDGSSVHLNASSSLQFPSRFATHLRKVTLIGQAYFEVAKNPKQPFQVESKGQQLTVLGTHFDISAYPDETVKTTLAEGSVQLTHSSSLKKQILQPEQQALQTSNGFELKQVNSADEMAWKDGMFIFKQTPIQEVLRQLARWYNVEVDLSNLPNSKLDVELSRKSALEDVIKVMNFGNRDGVEIQLTKTERRLISIKRK